MRTNTVKIKEPRIRKNTVERNFEELMASLGYETLHRGWPDYLVKRPDGTYMAVECKPRTTKGHMVMLSQHQVKCMDFLQSFGVACYVSDGATLEPYRRHIHRPPWRERKHTVSIIGC